MNKKINIELYFNIKIKVDDAMTKVYENLIDEFGVDKFLEEIVPILAALKIPIYSTCYGALVE